MRSSIVVVLFAFVAATFLFLRVEGVSDIDLDEVDFDEDDLFDDEEDFHSASPPKPTKAKSTDEFDDDEEFVGLPKPPVKRKPLERTSAPPKPRGGFVPQEHYYYEVAALVFLAVYLINFVIGMKTNSRIAHEWMEAHIGIFEENFSRCPSPTGELLKKDTHSTFKLYATGRVNCEFVYVTISLVRRHDLVLYIWDLVNSYEDEVTVEVSMDEEAMGTYVFAIMPRKKWKVFNKEIPDLQTFARPVATEVRKLSADVLVAAEVDEVVAPLMTPDVVAVVNRHLDAISLIRFSDQGGDESKRVLSFSYKLVGVEETGHLLKMAMFFIDQVAKTKLSKAAVAKTKRARIIAAEEADRQAHEERQEEAQTRKLERIREKKAAEAEAYARMTPEQRRRHDEKEFKRLKKVQGQKQRMMVRA